MVVRGVEVKTSKIKTINSSRKNRNCDWCSEIIRSGDSYKYYFCFGEGTSVSMHPECFEAMENDPNNDPDHDEFISGYNPRGCNCGFDVGCCKQGGV